jgi:DNA-binding MarR family transcriptional regulator/N-acetylglutamate synthase-like GNAT family acetyltransferase
VSQPELHRQTETIRRFNRFYTARIGVLNEGHLHSPFSLTEVRVLYELAHRAQATASELGRDLGLDAGYLSRMLRKFEQQGLIRKENHPADARQSHLVLTDAGRAAFTPLEHAARADIARLLEPLPAPERARLVDALSMVEGLLSDAPASVVAPAEPYLLRPHRPGDLGWIVHRHGVLYHREYGWDESFEALVAEIAAQLLRNFDAACERGWIAEKDGRIVGSVFVVRHAKTVAKLRLLYVEPETRGLGLGRRLVRECIDFARAAGYRKLMLWTNNVLSTARHLYVENGFKLVKEEAHHSFGHDLVGETWELKL